MTHSHKRKAEDDLQDEDSPNNKKQKLLWSPALFDGHEGRRRVYAQVDERGYFVYKGNLIPFKYPKSNTVYNASFDNIDLDTSTAIEVAFAVTYPTGKLAVTYHMIIQFLNTKEVSKFARTCAGFQHVIFRQDTHVLVKRFWTDAIRRLLVWTHLSNQHTHQDIQKSRRFILDNQVEIRQARMSSIADYLMTKYQTERLWHGNLRHNDSDGCCYFTRPFANMTYHSISGFHKCALAAILHIRMPAVTSGDESRTKTKITDPNDLELWRLLRKLLRAKGFATSSTKYDPICSSDL